MMPMCVNNSPPDFNTILPVAATILQRTRSFSCTTSGAAAILGLPCPCC